MADRRMNKNVGKTNNRKKDTGDLSEQFILFANNDESLLHVYDEICQSALSQTKICVVSVIGKDQLPSIKQKIISTILGQIRDNSQCQPGEIQLTGTINKKTKIVVLCLSSFLDTDRLLELAQNKEIENDKLFDLWPNLNQNLIKTLSIVYILSHIIIVYHPEPNFDCQLIETFHALEDLRLKSQPRICQVIAENLSSANNQQCDRGRNEKFVTLWLRNGRLCCPRVLFVFCNFAQTELGCDLDLHLDKIKKLERQLENHIYKILKKTNIVSNGNENLFQLPARDYFVFLMSSQDIDFLLPDDHIIEKQNEFDTYVYKKSTKFYDQLLDLLDDSVSSFLDRNSIPRESLAEFSGEGADKTKSEFGVKKVFENRFKDFIRLHTNQILQLTGQAHHRQGSKAIISTTTTVLPKLVDFLKVLCAIKNEMFEKTNDAKNNFGIDERRFVVDIHEHYDIDRRFSLAHCEVMIEAALELYNRGLPRQYDEEMHEIKLFQATQFYEMHAFGEAFHSCLLTLTERCNQIWTEGRKLCKESTSSSNKIHHRHRQKHGGAKFSRHDTRPSWNKKNVTKDYISDEQQKQPRIYKTRNYKIITYQIKESDIKPEGLNLS